MTAFVPTYRCGAVPDSHRVPFFGALKTKRTDSCMSIYSSESVLSTQNVVSQLILGDYDLFSREVVKSLVQMGVGHSKNFSQSLGQRVFEGALINVGS